MGQHPLNLALRFLLEIAALVAAGYWGWTQHDGALRYVLAIGVPLVAALLWGTFRVAGEPNSGPPVVSVPGIVRLLLEIAILGFAVWALFDAGATVPAAVFGIVLLVHYAISYDRIGWLLRG
jgi:hypothetical protein